MYALVNCMLHGITRIVTSHLFQPHVMQDIIETYGVTIFVPLPNVLAKIRNSGPSYHRCLRDVKIYCSGNILPEKLLQHINGYLNHNLCLIYGLSEFTDIVALNELGDPLGSSGALNDNVSVRIVDESGNRQGVGELGELLVWSNVPAIGYLSNPEATANLLNSEGWMRTEDIGYFDENGFLYVVSRKKALIYYLGIRVNSSIVENLIMQLNGVAEVCVVGVSNTETVELPAAVIKRNFQVSNEVTEEQVQAIVKGDGNCYVHIL